MSESYKVVAGYSNIAEAQLAKGQLESAGIPSKILNDDAGGMEPQLQFAQGVYVVVHESNWEKASAILSPEEGEASQ